MTGQRDKAMGKCRPRRDYCVSIGSWVVIIQLHFEAHNYYGRPLPLAATPAVAETGAYGQSRSPAGPVFTHNRVTTKGQLAKATDYYNRK